GQHPREPRGFTPVLDLNVGLDHAGLHHEEDVLSRLVDRHEPRPAVAERAAASFGGAAHGQARSYRSKESNCKGSMRSMHGPSPNPMDVATSPAPTSNDDAAPKRAEIPDDSRNC